MTTLLIQNIFTKSHYRIVANTCLSKHTLTHWMLWRHRYKKPLFFFGLCLRDTEEHLSPHYLNNAWNVLQSADELSKRFKYLSWTERYQSRF